MISNSSVRFSGDQPCFFIELADDRVGWRFPGVAASTQDGPVGGPCDLGEVVAEMEEDLAVAVRRSRVRMAAAMTVIRLGLQRAREGSART